MTRRRTYAEDRLSGGNIKIISRGKHAVDKLAARKTASYALPAYMRKMKNRPRCNI